MRSLSLCSIRLYTTIWARYFGPPPTLDEFKAAVSHHKGSTAPGATGLTHNMVKGWPDSVISRVHELLTLAFAGPTPTWLQWGLLCPKPKDPSVSITLDGLRPLMLLEVLRKIWLWIHVRKIVHHWEAHQILTQSQHGFRRGHGTDSTLLVHLNCLEHARHTNSPLFLSSWDIRRAFDSVSKEAMDASWRRLGVPAVTPHWIAHLDDQGPTAVRSPWALDAWRRAHYAGLPPGTSPAQPGTFIRERGTPQGDVTSPHAWTAFFDIALRALDMTDPASHFHMPSHPHKLVAVSDVGYPDDLVSLSSSLDGLQHKADIISAFALLFDFTISAPKLRAACLGTGPLNPSLTIHGPGWTPTRIPVRTTGTITILGLTLDLDHRQTTQTQSTKAHLTQASTILGFQKVTDTAALVASISTMAKAAYTAQFIPWSPQDLQALDVPLNRAFRRLLQLPSTHPNALLYMRTTEGGLGLPRLSDEVNLRKWSMACRLHERGGLPGAATQGLLTRASEVSGGSFLLQHQGDFIGPFSITPVWGSSLGALGPDTALRLSPTLGPVSHPLLRPLTLGLDRLDDVKLLRALRRLNLSTWADVTTRSPDGTRHWLNLATLLPEVVLPSFPPPYPPWPGDLDASRPGQFWRLTPGLDEWAWGGIYQILGSLPERDVLALQRWSALPGAHNRTRPIIRTGSSTTLHHRDFVLRVTHRLLVSTTKTPGKGTIHAEFPDSLGPPSPPTPSWSEPLRSLLPGSHTWSVYTDASWRATQPLQAQAVFGNQGTHEGRGALFLSADSPDWCSHFAAARFEIPPTLRALSGTAQVAELLAIYLGLSLLSTLNLRGTVYSDCLAAVKKITRRWTPGRAFLDAGAALVTAARALLSPDITVQWTKGHPERSNSPPINWTRQQRGIYVADALTKNRDVSTLPHSPIPVLQIHQIAFQDLLSTVTPSHLWHWADNDNAPPLGNLRSMVSLFRALAYRANRDHLRAQRGAAPIWSDSHLAASATPWLKQGQPLRQRVQGLRTLWDLRWHGENREIASHSPDPQVSACPICHRFWSQAYVLCNCPGTTNARSGGTLDLSIAINHLPPGPMLELGRKFQTLLIIPNHPTLMARRWAGQWDQAAISALRPEIANCTRKQLQAVLGHIGRVTSSTATACWREFLAMARELTPPQL